MSAKLAGAGSGYALGQNADINVTPFVDIMLVLLIVMMVAVPAATLAIQADLPPVSEQKTVQKLPTFISLAADGALTVVDADRGAQPAPLAGLASVLLQDLGPGARQRSILIRADRGVRYGAFMAVVNQLQVDGFYKVSLIPEDRPA